MEKLIFYLVVFCMLATGCVQENVVNSFSSDQDTLLVETVKHKGQGLFSAGAGRLHFTDTAEAYYPLVYPEDIDSLQIAHRFIDIKVWRLKRYLKGEIDNEYVIKDVEKGYLDTLNYASTEQNYLNILSGHKGSERVFIVDENNNKDFTDDSIRLCKKMKWEKFDGLIPVSYVIYDGDDLVADSSWVNIGQLSGGSLLFHVSQHLTADILLDGKDFQIGFGDRQSGFTYDLDPLLALLAEDGVYVDTLYKKDILYRNEYVKLGESYYRFDHITNSGKYVTLIKDDGFESKKGTQLGMLAPDFTCKTYAGDTLNSINLHEKPLLIANISGCTSRSFSVYSKMCNEYGNQLTVIGLTPHITKDYGGILADTEEPFNKGLYDHYRHAYSSYTCYLIGTDNRIKDIFSVFDWESHLPPFFGDDSTVIKTDIDR